MSSLQEDQEMESDENHNLENVGQDESLDAIDEAQIISQEMNMVNNEGDIGGNSGSSSATSGQQMTGFQAQTVRPDARLASEASGTSTSNMAAGSVQDFTRTTDVSGSDLNNRTGQTFEMG